MGKRQDITENDQELDEELDDDELDDDAEEVEDEDAESKPAPKRQKDSPEMREIKQSLLQLTQIVGQQGTKADKEKVSKVDAMFATLLGKGYKEEDLAPMAAVVQALTEDIKEKIGEASAADKKLSLDDRCRKAVHDRIAEHTRDFPAVGWAKDEIANRVRHLLANGEEFESARIAYTSGQEPSAADFKKATAKVVRTFLKESGIKSGDSKSSPEQLDMKSSAKSVTKGISKDGKTVDLDQLSEFERDVYVTTKNYTKSDELAKEALQAIRGKKF